MKKIKILLPEADWHEFAAETLWASPLGNNRYILDNSPFFANDISYQDTVYAEIDDNDDQGYPIFKKVVERSGHSTYRLFLEREVTFAKFEEYFKELQEIGCTYEGMHNTHFSVDVPAQTDIMKAFKLLKKGEEDEVWFFESSHIGHEVNSKD